MPRPENLPSEIAWHRFDSNEAGVLPARGFDAVIAAEVIETSGKSAAGGAGVVSNTEGGWQTDFVDS